GDRNAELRDAFDEFAGAVERIDYPYSGFVEASKVVHGLFRQPAFAGAKKRLAQNVVDSPVGFCDRIVSGLVFGFDGSRGEAVQDFAGRLEGGMNAFQSLFG